MGLLIVDADGEGSNVGGCVGTSSEGIEDRLAGGGGGNRDVSVQGALSHGIEGIARSCDSDEISGREEAADGIQELWGEGRRGHDSLDGRAEVRC